MALLKDVGSTGREDRMKDVDFEHSVRVLTRVWESFPQPSSSVDEVDQQRLCRALRNAKVCFSDVDRWYRKGYDTSTLERLIGQIGKATPGMPDSRYSYSIRRHVREFLGMVKRRNNPRRRGEAYYASSCA